MHPKNYTNMIDLLYIIAGFVLLVKGGDYLVDGAVSIARFAKLSPMIIGMTVIGFGTSCPELLVSTQAAIAGSPGIAIGNVVGSNIANIALILGVTALIHPVPTTRQIVYRDGLCMLYFVIAMCVFAYTLNVIDRWEGAIMVAVLVLFVSWQIRSCRKSGQDQSAAEAEGTNYRLPVAVLLVLVSFGAMVLGSNLLVEGATDVARLLGVSERVIGLTIVAVGTSLPELFASVIAARKGQTDMAVGNIIGSVSFNCLCVVGIASVVTPIQDSAVGFIFDYVWMTVLSAALLFMLRTDYRLTRREGVVLTLAYVIYIIMCVRS